MQMTIQDLAKKLYYSDAERGGSNYLASWLHVNYEIKAYWVLQAQEVLANDRDHHSADE